MKTILIIDDNEEYRESLRLALEKRELETIECDCPDTAFGLLKTVDKPDLILCDLHMPFTFGQDKDDFVTSFEVGVKTIRELAWVYPETPVVALTALPPIDLAKIKKYLSPIPAYSKPERMDDVVEIVEAFVECHHYGGMQ